MKLRDLALFVVVCALVEPAYAASPVKPGKWQMTIQSEMSNVPFKIPPISFTQCITKEQAEDAEAGIPKNRKDSDCKYTDVKVDGNTISWKINCAKSKMTGTGNATYSGDSFTGSSEMKMADGEITMKGKYSGKRLGECDEK